MSLHGDDRSVWSASAEPVQSGSGRAGTAAARTLADRDEADVSTAARPGVSSGRHALWGSVLPVGPGTRFTINFQGGTREFALAVKGADAGWKADRTALV